MSVIGGRISMDREFNRLMEVVSEERFWVVAGKFLRKMTFETVSAHVFFQADLQQMFAPRACPHGITIRQYEGLEQLDTVVAFLKASPLPPPVIAYRLRRGDRVAIAFCGEETAGYSWMNSSGAHYVEEVGRMLIFGPHEVLQHDAYVLPPWRGRSLQAVLSSHIRKHAQLCGYRYALAYVDALNSRSFNSQKGQGKQIVECLLSLRLPKTQRYFNFRLGGPRRLLFRNVAPELQTNSVLVAPNSHKQVLPAASRNL